MPLISATIITCNVDRYVARCIQSALKVADEIVVIDSFSTDKTKEICLANGVKFIERPFTSYSEQKNFAVSQAKFDHILSLDADEYLSEELINSILKMKESWSSEAFKMNRMSTYGGRWIKHGSWYPDRQLRLWNKNFGRWQDKRLHEVVGLSNGTKIKRLKGDLLHESYDDSYVALKKIQLYSDLFAQQNKGKITISVFGIHVHTIFAFLKSYILKRGILDGFEGLMVAAAVANHTFYKYTKLYEANRKAGQS